MLNNWRPEWAWFWHRQAGKVDPSSEVDLSRLPFHRAPSRMLSLRAGVLTELGRLDEQDRLEWAEILCELPLETSTRRVESALRRCRLGQDARPAAEDLSHELDLLVARHRRSRNTSLDDVDAALRAAQALVEWNHAVEQDSAPEAPHMRVEVPPRVRVAVPEVDDELLLAECGGVLLRASAPAKNLSVASRKP